MLLYGDQTVTLVKHNKVDDSYKCYSMGGASWHGQVSIVTSGDGAKPTNTFTVRVPEKDMPTGVFPETGDYIVRGVVASISRPADLKELEYFRITAVGNNLRGNLPHWRVSGS